ncbi:hypothetical protein SAMN02982917_2359 [Azospirillum oryzae]|uniref:Uncharacterized protein n=1 Tax=Azospirillum oryzae TaxID=286727 RepID=A0A1X7F8Y1_9PROT|nr:hypothetical protein [Azospirillum oryzae]SMF48254.1 hypothetical protein SAMN02982917_2359 [Azospirillum oryzae]
MTVLHSEVLRGLVVTALRNANTLAADRVFAPRDWPVNSKDMPCLLVADEREESRSRGAVGFPALHTTAIITVDGRVEGVDEVAVKADLATLRSQIKTAVLTSYEIVRQVEQIAAVRSQVAVSAETKKHVGELRMEFAFSYPEDFEPVVTDELQGVDVHVDMIAPFDATGTYPDPPFPDAVQPAPRTSGPDGRDEGRLTFDFP